MIFFPIKLINVPYIIIIIIINAIYTGYIRSYPAQAAHIPFCIWYIWRCCGCPDMLASYN
jgi:hypothetical protein